METFDLSFVAKACLAPDTPNGASSKVLVEQGGGEPFHGWKVAEDFCKEGSAC